MSWHKIIPYGLLLLWYSAIRRVYFKKPRPRGEYLVVDMGPDDVESLLGVRNFAPNWELSYYKAGENMNLSRVQWHYDEDYPEYRWWQLHVRGWEEPDGTWLRAHWELEPSENGHAHIEEIGYSASAGMTALKFVLDDANVEFNTKIR